MNPQENSHDWLKLNLMCAIQSARRDRFTGLAEALEALLRRMLAAEVRA